MTDHELKKLKREDLLELLIAQIKENEALQARLDRATAQLDSRRITVDNAGSIAEAALQLNGVFEAAQNAAEQYLENLRQRSSEQEQFCAQREAESREQADKLLSETEETCRRLEAETKQKCESMVEQAKQESESYWRTLSEKLESFYQDHAGLKELLAVQEKRLAGQ